MRTTALTTGLLAAALHPLPAAHAQLPANQLVSQSSAGVQANDTSYYSLVAGGGRYVVFQSDASNLVPNDFNGRQDIFRRDLETGATELVSVSLAGTSANGIAVQPDVTADGRYVVWSSNATDLVANDPNGTWDVFVRDMVAGVTTLLSVDSSGNPATARSDNPRITPAGQYVVFESDADLVPADTNGLKDVYRLDRQTGNLALCSVTAAGVQGDGWSYHGAPSASGLRVVFTSAATTLDPTDTNNQVDIFVKDLVTGALSRVNVSTAGAQSNGESTWPSISGDGLVVTYCSTASTLVPGDTNQNWDLFARDLVAGTTTRLNVQPSGLQANSYVRSPTALSFDGNLVVFASLSTNLVAGDTNGKQDIFLRDRRAATTTRVSLDASGGEPDGDSFVPHMTPDGRWVTYTSDATDLVASDGNGRRDIFAAQVSEALGLPYCALLNQPNSTGRRGVLSATGSPFVADNDVTFHGTNLPPNSFALLVVGTLAQPVLNPTGPTLCISGVLGRFLGPGQVQNAGPAGVVSIPVDLTQIPTPTGFVSLTPGETRHFDLWHRDVPTGGAGYNFTNALEILFR